MSLPASFFAHRLYEIHGVGVSWLCDGEDGASELRPTRGGERPVPPMASSPASKSFQTQSLFNHDYRQHASDTSTPRRARVRSALDNRWPTGARSGRWKQPLLLFHLVAMVRSGRLYQHSHLHQSQPPGSGQCPDYYERSKTMESANQRDT